MVETAKEPGKGKVVENKVPGVEGVPGVKDPDGEKLELIQQAGEAGLQVAADNLPTMAQPKWLKLVMQKQIKDELAPKATMGEFGMFIYRCARLGLDPMLKQAYLLPFGKGNSEEDDELGTKKVQHAMVVGIDGFRAKTRDQGMYTSVTQWCGEDEVWKEVWLKMYETLDPSPKTGATALIKVPLPPAAARVGIRFEDQREFTYGLATYNEFCVMMYNKKLKVKVPGPMWMKSPANQLAKCAEAQGHRKLNGSILAGVYIREELEQALLGHAVPTQAGLLASAEAGNGDAAQSLASMAGQPEGTVLAAWATKLATCKTVEDYKKLWEKEGQNFGDTGTMQAAHAALSQHRSEALGRK